MSFQFVPIPSSIAEEVRRTDRSPRYGHLLEIPLVLEAYVADRWPLSRDPARSAEVDPAIARLLAIPAVEHLHVRNRKAGCYIAQVERVRSKETERS
jgi:Protein of unknown function (DUF1203)